MRRRRAILTMFAFTILAPTGWGCGGGSRPDPTADPRFDGLRQRSSTPVELRLDSGGVIRTASGTFARVSTSSDAGAEAAAFAQAYQDLLPIKVDQLQERERRTLPSGGTVVVYDVRDKRDGLPVFDAELRIAVAAGGGVTFLSAKAPADLAVPATAAVAAADAITAALEDLGVNASFSPAEPPVLGIFNAGLTLGTATPSDLVWSFVIEGPTDDTDVQVYVDATAGDVVDRISLTPTELGLRLYTAKNKSTRADIQASRELWFTEAGQVSGTTPDETARAIFANATRVYDYFKGVHGHDSFDGRGLPQTLFVYVHYNPPSWSNAIYCGRAALCFGDTRNAVDTFAHEFTHGVIGHTARLKYSTYSGAINESLADTFGALVDTGEPWLHGGRYADGPVRNLIDPKLRGHPRHWDQRVPIVSEHGPCRARRPRCDAPQRCAARKCRRITADHGGVHTNSNILNHAAYLLAAGPPGTIREHADSRVKVRSIGVAKAEKIYYAAMTTFLGPRSDFHDLRDGMLAACKDHVSAGTRAGGAPIETRDCGAVINAFYAVGIGPGPDPDEDTVVTGDKCPNDYDPKQEDTDGDKIGDACEADAGTTVAQLPRCPSEIVFHDGKRYLIGHETAVENLYGTCQQRTGGDSCPFEVAWSCLYTYEGLHGPSMRVHITRTGDTPRFSCDDAVNMRFAETPGIVDFSAFSGTRHVLVTAPGWPPSTPPPSTELKERYLQDLRVAAQAYVEELEPYAHTCD